MSLNSGDKYTENWQIFRQNVDDSLRKRGFTVEDHETEIRSLQISKNGFSLPCTLLRYWYPDGDPEKIADYMEKHWRAKVA